MEKSEKQFSALIQKEIMKALKSMRRNPEDGHQGYESVHYDVSGPNKELFETLNQKVGMVELDEKLSKLTSKQELEVVLNQINIMHMQMKQIALMIIQ